MRSDPNCLFCKIVAGQIPCHRVYEDPTVLAFLDIGPLSRGHTLLIPKTHAERIEELPAEVGAALGGIVPRLGRALVRATACSGWNLLQNNGPVAGQVVPHVHVHLIPRREGDGLGYRWPAGKLDPAEARRLVEAIQEHLQQA